VLSSSRLGAIRSAANSRTMRSISFCSSENCSRVNTGPTTGSTRKAPPRRKAGPLAPAVTAASAPLFFSSIVFCLLIRSPSEGANFGLTGREDYDPAAAVRLNYSTKLLQCGKTLCGPFHPLGQYRDAKGLRLDPPFWAVPTES
jgi:hypothetical protein